MFIKSFIGAVCALVLICGTSIANAATISFNAPSISANVNDIITLDVLMDFTGAPTLGGGTDIFYDSTVLSFQSFSFATTTLSLDPAFSRTPDVLSNKLEGLAFGNFNGLSGPGTVGTLSFQVIASGNTALSMAETTSALGGGAFISATTFGPQTVSFGSTNVNINAVPLPAAVWLFGSGLIGLIGLIGVTRKQM